MSRRRPAPGRLPDPPPLTVDVVDGDGMIEMVGDDMASMLLLAGEPALLQGDTAGYSWLFARAGTQGSAEVKSLVEPAAGPAYPDTPDGPVGPDDPAGGLPDPQRALLRPLLPLLRPGRYLVTVRSSSSVYRVGFDRPGDHVWHFDPYEGPLEDVALVATDTWPPRDRARVAHYRELIARGRRPALVALFPPDGFTGYLLDGHHKLAAYGPADPPPRVVAVTPMRPFLPGNDQVRRAVAAFVDAVSEDNLRQVVNFLDHLRTLSLGVESEADELARIGRSVEAIARYRDYLEHQRRYLAREELDEHRAARVRLAVAENRHKLGRLLLRHGQRDEAEEHLRAALDGYVTLLGERHPATVDLVRELGGPAGTPADPA